MKRSACLERVSGDKTVEQARNYYAKEFADARRKQPAPYMERLHFAPRDRSAADPDTRMLSDDDLKQAINEGKQKGQANDRPEPKWFWSSNAETLGYPTFSRTL